MTATSVPQGKAVWRHPERHDEVAGSLPRQCLPEGAPRAGPLRDVTAPGCHCAKWRQAVRGEHLGVPCTASLLVGTCLPLIDCCSNSQSLAGWLWQQRGGCGGHKRAGQAAPDDGPQRSQPQPTAGPAQRERSLRLLHGHLVQPALPGAHAQSPRSAGSCGRCWQCEHDRASKVCQAAVPLQRCRR